MTDREKVKKGVEHCFHGQECCGDIECPYYIEHLSDCCCLEECQENLKTDVIALLEEQQQQIWELQDQVEYLTDKQKEQEATIEILVKDITFHNCNNCNRKDCESKPNAGQPVRSNCIYWLESR